VKPAPWPREEALSERLLSVSVRAGTFEDRHVGDLPSLLGPGDLLVLNDAATLPGSLHGRTEAGEAIELRLSSVSGTARFEAVLFGAGDFHTRTEHRPPPPKLSAGAVLRLGPDLWARVESVSSRHPRLLEVKFEQDGAALWAGLFRVGRPVQYAHVKEPLPLWHVQTAYAARPWSAEQPSAGRPLKLGLLQALRAKGVALATITHGCGLSSTGDAQLDAALPLPERYEIPAATVEAVRAAKRVIAVGTSVTRSLEGSAAANGGVLTPGTGVTDLRLSGAHRLGVAHGLLTGMHEPGTSHDQLLEAFAPRAVIDGAFARAEELGYLGHEFGDSMLLL
jgi:S-adenosylmethionine:tRNA ribosyltransferase-isomerase